MCRQPRETGLPLSMHVIRLRSAWEPSAPETTGSSRFQRSFGKPTNLDAGQRVFLVVQPPPAGPVQLNGQLLPADATADGAGFRCDITALLNIRNVLSIETNSPTFEHEARLEIVE